MARIDLIKVSKTLTDRKRGAGDAAPHDGRRTAFSLCDLNLSVRHGETMVILGPSGCGKTTLLKIIAGLLPLDTGEVRYDGLDVRDVAPGDRRIGMVFQNYALYPHFESRTNVLSYFLFRKKTPELDALAKAKYQRTSDLMGVDLAHLLDRKPTSLSGGEKQRVALGRCITRDAALFLVDEPFANLDQALREKYRVNLKALLRQFSITTVYVTHDHNEALILADRLAIMNCGRIEQVGTFQEIYDDPQNVFVASFLNLNIAAPPLNLIDGRQLPERLGLGDVLLGVRPEHAQAVHGASAEGTVGVRGVVTSALRLPTSDATSVAARVGDQDVYARAAAEGAPDIGDVVWLTFRRYYLFDKATGMRVRRHIGAEHA